MNILQLCSKPPIPALDGGRIAMHSITTGLVNQKHGVKVFSLSTQKHPVIESELSDTYKASTSFEYYPINTKVTPLGIAKNILNSSSYNVDRFYNKSVEQKIVHLLATNQFDIVHLESLFMAPYISCIRKNSDAKIVLRSHNIEHVIWERRALSTSSFIKKSYLLFLAKRLKKYEIEVMNNVDGIACISKSDLSTYKKLGCKTDLINIPFGIDLDDYLITPKNNHSPSIFSFGTMDWKPNEEGVKWFIKEIWPSITNEFPSLLFHIAGKNMPQWISELNDKNIVVHETVPDKIHFINSMDIMIVPLLSGGGIRIKILEGMALGKAIISTVIGAEGINYTNNKDILLANNSIEFVNQLKVLLNDKVKKQEIEKNAIELVYQSYKQKNIINSLTEFYKKL
ncbi:MAG: glycosyltransferase family 4 protein [Flavobacteriales bacterium]|nr:glycosyltransferase family 4 protein [Flavobacteriales bacterium]